MGKQNDGVEPADRGLVWCDKCDKAFGNWQDCDVHYFKEHFVNPFMSNHFWLK